MQPANNSSPVTRKQPKHKNQNDPQSSIYGYISLKAAVNRAMEVVVVGSFECFPPD